MISVGILISEAKIRQLVGDSERGFFVLGIRSRCSNNPQKTQPDRYGRTATYSNRLSPLLKMVGGAYRRSGWVLQVQSHHGDPNERDKSVYHCLCPLVFRGLFAYPQP